MEETLALRESFSMVANLIGPTKWIPLARHMQIYPDEQFEDNLAKLNSKHRHIPERIWNCLMHWKLSVGKSAKVTQLIDSLHAIELHWLAVSISNHLIAEGYNIPRRILPLPLKKQGSVSAYSSVAPSTPRSQQSGLV
ncbi:hypothetical protein EB796_000100 [Bugula neritina]|uniref:Death domain-containing protein n=1 Tax=Bugula neritina TaxID=10212 RepID=A0A7J7KTU1_BUGNE|nr:hypothetical protein EB796_000100 [Bugula neritina]